MTTDQLGWTVTIDAVTKPDVTTADAVEGFVDLLADFDGAVSYGQAGDRYSATFSVLADWLGSSEAPPSTVADVASGMFWERANKAGLPIPPEATMVRLEVVTFAEHDAELEQPPIPELVGISEIAERLGVTRQRAHQITQRKGFPEPATRLASGPVWTLSNVERALEEWRLQHSPAGEPPDLHTIDERWKVFRDAFARNAPLNELANYFARLLVDLRDATGAEEFEAWAEEREPSLSQ